MGGLLRFLIRHHLTNTKRGLEDLNSAVHKAHGQKTTAQLPTRNQVPSHLQHLLVQPELSLCDLVDVVVHGTLQHHAVDPHRARLAQTVRAVLSLAIDLQQHTGV